MIFHNDLIQLTETEGSFYSPKLLIDLIFESLANNMVRNAIEIILEPAQMVPGESALFVRKGNHNCRITTNCHV